MNRALELAREALGGSSPNPPVGAVVVKDGQVLGEGHTLPPGQAHAEVVALGQAREQSRGATLYTTPEPCCHFGRTPPCTREIIQSGITEVYAALIDPNPLVSYMGITELQEAGIKTHLGQCELEAREIAEGYIKLMETGLPFVIAKFAMTLDGKIATGSGEARWITSEPARRYAAELRRQSDAVMVGIGTALMDDPRLTARDDQDNALDRQPLRIIIDSSARLSPGAQLFREPGSVLVATAKAMESEIGDLRSAGAQVISLPTHDDTVDLRLLLGVLGQQEVTNVLVEGGETLLGSLFDLGIVDKVVAFVAPVIFGGYDAPSPVGGEGVSTLADALRLRHSRVDVLGPDVVITGYVR